MDHASARKVICIRERVFLKKSHFISATMIGTHVFNDSLIHFSGGHVTISYKMCIIEANLSSCASEQIVSELLSLIVRVRQTYF